MNTPFKAFFLISLCLTGGIAQEIWAAAPVFDLNQDNDNQAIATPAPSNFDQLSPAASPHSLPIEDRLQLIEQQVSNLAQMDLPGKIDNLQQQLQQINGQLEVQAHDIQNLMAQQHNSAQDLNSSPAKNPDSTENTNSPETTTASKIAQAEANVTRNAPIAQKASTASDVVTAGSEPNAYQKAFNLLVDKKNDQALVAFQAFLKAYPKGTHAPNAHYWLAELYLMDNKNDLASQEFLIVTQKFPNYAKVPDSILKLAIIHDNAGQHAQAQKELQEIITRFPNSSAARSAKMRLKQGNPPSLTP